MPSSDAIESTDEMYIQVSEVTIDFHPKDAKLPLPYYERVPKHTSKSKGKNHGSKNSSHALQSLKRKTTDSGEEPGARVVKKQRIHNLPAVPVKVRHQKSNVPTHTSNDLHTPKRKATRKTSILPNGVGRRKSQRIAARKSLSPEDIPPVPTSTIELKDGVQTPNGHVLEDLGKASEHAPNNFNVLPELSSISELSKRATLHSRKRKSLPASSSGQSERPTRRRRSTPSNTRDEPLFPNLVGFCRPLPESSVTDGPKEPTHSSENASVNETEHRESMRRQKRKSLPTASKTEAKSTTRRHSVAICKPHEPLFPNLTRPLPMPIFTGPVKSILKNWIPKALKDCVPTEFKLDEAYDEAKTELESISTQSTDDEEESMPEIDDVDEKADNEDSSAHNATEEEEETNDEDSLATATAEAAERRFNGLDDETEYMRNWLRKVQRKKAEVEEASNSQVDTTQEIEEDNNEEAAAEHTNVPLSPNREAMWPKSSNSPILTRSRSPSSPNKRSREADASEDDSDELSYQPAPRRRSTRSTTSKAPRARNTISIKRQDGLDFRLQRSADVELAHLTNANTDANRGRYKNAEMLQRLKARGEAHVPPEEHVLEPEPEPENISAEERGPLHYRRRRFSIMRTPRQREAQQLRELAERDRRENEGLERVWAKERRDEAKRRKSGKVLLWDEQLAYYPEEIRALESVEREKAEVERVEKVERERRERKRAARRVERGRPDTPAKRKVGSAGERR